MSDQNYENLSLDDFMRWKVEALKNFLADRGLKRTGRKEELAAVAYAAATQLKVPVLPSATEEKRQHAQQYRELLKYGDIMLPDPVQDLTTGWLGESKGILQWPPTSYIELANHLAVPAGEPAGGSGSTTTSRTSHSETKARSLKQRLLSDYKEGKAYSYFDSKWLKEVFYHPVTENSAVAFLKAECIPSENVRQVPHSVWVCAEKSSGTVHSAYCTCHAGLSSSCNHVAAVLFKMDYAYQRGWTSKSCTSLPCEWNKFSGGANVNELLEGKRISDMELRKPSYSKDVDAQQSVNPPTRKMFQPSKRSSSSEISTITSALFSSVSKSSLAPYIKVPQPQAQNYTTEDDVNVDHTIEVSSSYHLPLSLPQLASQAQSTEEFLGSVRHFTAEEVAVIEKETLGQHNNPVWYRQREGRITASLAHNVLTKIRTIKMKEATSSSEIDTSSLVKRIMGYTKPSEDILALQHGRKHEETARGVYASNAFTKHDNFNVEQSGLHVSREIPFLGSTPDGIVSCGCCGSGILEIKCPFSIYGQTPTPKNLSYLTNEDEQVKLKKSHQYYTQVQMQMGVTGFKWCDFFVYTGADVDSHEERIAFDKKRWTEIVESSTRFFKDYLAVELVTKNIKMSQPSTSSASTSKQSATSSEPASSLPSPPLTKEKNRPRKKKRRIEATPLYVCGSCKGQCKNTSDIVERSDNSVGCDRCRQWFHWSCANFDEVNHQEGAPWYCSTCKD